MIWAGSANSSSKGVIPILTPITSEDIPLHPAPTPSIRAEGGATGGHTKREGLLQAMHPHYSASGQGVCASCSSEHVQITACCMLEPPSTACPLEQPLLKSAGSLPMPCNAILFRPPLTPPSGIARGGGKAGGLAGSMQHSAGYLTTEGKQSPFRAILGGGCTTGQNTGCVDPRQ